MDNQLTKASPAMDERESLGHTKWDGKYLIMLNGGTAPYPASFRYLGTSTGVEAQRDRQLPAGKLRRRWRKRLCTPH